MDQRHLDTVTALSELCDLFNLNPEDKKTLFALWEPFRSYKEDILVVSNANKEQLLYQFLVDLNRHGEKIVRTFLHQNCQSDWLEVSIQLMDFQSTVAKAINAKRIQ
jgi:hypothetical protein